MPEEIANSRFPELSTQGVKLFVYAMEHERIAGSEQEIMYAGESMPLLGSPPRYGYTEGQFQKLPILTAVVPFPVILGELGRSNRKVLSGMADLTEISLRTETLVTGTGSRDWKYRDLPTVLDDQTVDWLATLPLTSLTLSGFTGVNVFWRKLHQFRRLQSLALYSAEMTELPADSLALLAELPELKSLFLGQMNFCGSSLAPIRQCHKLVTLFLEHCCQYTDLELIVGHLPRLVQLAISGYFNSRTELEAFAQKFPYINMHDDVLGWISASDAFARPKGK